jgi:hypothetical protein
MGFAPRMDTPPSVMNGTLYWEDVVDEDKAVKI